MSVSFRKDRNTALITHSTFSQWLPSQRPRARELSSLCVWRHENGRGCRAQVWEKPDKFKNLPETSENEEVMEYLQAVTWKSLCFWGDKASIWTAFSPQSVHQTKHLWSKTPTKTWTNFILSGDILKASPQGS